jgi:hypothetical protein
MRILLVIILSAAAVASAAAQGNQSQPSPSGHSSGQTYLPSHQQHEEVQPQGRTGPLDTTTGGAPAESPQGQSPPGMQAAPEGSSKTIVDTK